MKKIILAFVMVVGLAGAGIYFYTQDQMVLPASLSGQDKTSNTNSLSGVVFQKTGGCGNIFVHTINGDDTIGISVSAGTDELDLSAQEKTFEIGKTSGLTVEMLRGQEVSESYCNDVVEANKPLPKKFTAKSGSATIKISGLDTSLPKWDRSYKATIILKDVHFFDANGKEAGTVEDLTLKDVNVGWMPG